MSRWYEEFKNHAFWTPFRKCLDLVDNIEIEDSDTALVDELARLRKVLTYLNELLNGIDPELVPSGNWNNFNTKATECFNQLTNFKSSSDIQYLKQANASSDTLLTYVRPFHVSDEHVAQSARKAFESYRSAISGSIGGLKTTVEAAKNDISELSNEANSHASNINSILSEAKRANLAINGSDDEPGIKSKLEALLERIEERKNQIEVFSQQLLDGESSIKSRVLVTRNSIEEAHEEITELLSDAKGELEGLESFHTKVFGERTDDGKVVGGLAKELETRRKDLEDFKAEQEDQYQILINKIDGLLPRATSAGLAGAYHDLKISFDKPIKWSARTFYFAITVLFVIAAATAVDTKVFLATGDFQLVDLSEFKNIMSSLALKLPLILPVVWLAVFAQRRRNEAQRLQQEYAHKEALAKSYESFKRQIDELGDEDKELSMKLLAAAIDAVAYNASVTLEGKHPKDLPTEELLNKAIELFKKEKELSQ